MQPRLKIIWWNALTDTRPTYLKLNALFKVDNILCPLCLCGVEFAFHLIWECEHARFFWWSTEYGLIPQSLRITDINEWMVSLIDHNLRLPDYVDKKRILFAAVTLLEEMWHRRNKLIHNGTPIDKVAMVSSIKCKINEFDSLAEVLVNSFPFWIALPAGFVKCNIDMAINNNRCIASYVVRDHDSRIVKLLTWPDVITDPLIAKALALSHAVKLILAENWDSVIFESDCKNLIESLTMEATGRLASKSMPLRMSER